MNDLNAILDKAKVENTVENFGLGESNDSRNRFIIKNMV